MEVIGRKSSRKNLWCALEKLMHRVRVIRKAVNEESIRPNAAYTPILPKGIVNEDYCPKPIDTTHLNGEQKTAGVNEPQQANSNWPFTEDIEMLSYNQRRPDFPRPRHHVSR